MPDLRPIFAIEAATHQLIGASEADFTRRYDAVLYALLHASENPSTVLRESVEVAQGLRLFDPGKHIHKLSNIFAQQPLFREKNPVSSSTAVEGAVSLNTSLALLASGLSKRAKKDDDIFLSLGSDLPPDFQRIARVGISALLSQPQDSGLREIIETSEFVQILGVDISQSGPHLVAALPSALQSLAGSVLTLPPASPLSGAAVKQLLTDGLVGLNVDAGTVIRSARESIGGIDSLARSCGRI